MHYPAVKGSLFNFTLTEVINVFKSYAHIVGHIHIHHGNLHIKIGASLNHMYEIVLKTFKDSFYSSEKHFLFDNCGFWVCEIKVFLWNLAIVSDGN